jgi:hypothetical protein
MFRLPRVSKATPYSDLNNDNDAAMARGLRRSKNDAVTNSNNIG